MTDKWRYACADCGCRTLAKRTRTGGYRCNREGHVMSVAERAKRNRDVPTTREEWADLKDDPTDADLGYETVSWGRMTDEASGREYLLSPDAGALDAYVVVTPSTLVDPEREV